MRQSIVSLVFIACKNVCESVGNYPIRVLLSSLPMIEFYKSFTYVPNFMGSRLFLVGVCYILLKSACILLTHSEFIHGLGS